MSRGSPGGVVEVSTSTVCRITDSTWQRSSVAHILGGPEVDPPPYVVTFNSQVGGSVIGTLSLSLAVLQFLNSFFCSLKIH